MPLSCRNRLNSNRPHSNPTTLSYIQPSRILALVFLSLISGALSLFSSLFLDIHRISPSATSCTFPPPRIGILFQQLFALVASLTLQYTQIEPGSRGGSNCVTTPHQTPINHRQSLLYSPRHPCRHPTPNLLSRANTASHSSASTGCACCASLPSFPSKLGPPTRSLQKTSLSRAAGWPYRQVAYHRISTAD